MKERTLWFVLIMLLVGASVSANKKEKQVLPSAVLKAETVCVIIQPEAKEPLNDPNANLKAQQEVEKAIMKWGRFRLTTDVDIADLVITVQKGTGKAADATISGGPIDSRPVIINGTDDQIRIGGQKGHPPSGTEIPDTTADGGRAHPGVQMGGGEDMLRVYLGGVPYPVDASPVWAYSAKDSLRPPAVAAVEQFRKVFEESEKAAAQKQKQQQQQQPAKPPTP
jgi:hypothetical protein